LLANRQVGCPTGALTLTYADLVDQSRQPNRVSADVPGCSERSPYLVARMRGFGTTIFSEMSALAVQTGSINLGQGFPDTDGPPEVLDAAIEAIRAGHNQYPPGRGIPALRLAIADHQQRYYGLAYDPNREVLVSAGATEAIAATVLALCETGDEVVVLEPTYDSYSASIALAGAVMRPVTLHHPDYRLDIEAVRAAISPRTRLLLINSPHNPTGRVLDRAELTAIADLAVERDLIVVTDEVYEHLTFDREHIPLATLPGMRDRTVTISSAGKTFSLTGWKIGYAIGPEPLQAALRAVHQFVTFATSTPFQEALADGMEEAARNGYYGELAAAYEDRRRILTNHLSDAGLEVLPVQGSYFLMAGFERLGFSTDMDFCRWLIAEIGVASIPPSAFYQDPSTAPKLARFCFAKRQTTIDEAGRRLKQLGAFRYSNSPS